MEKGTIKKVLSLMLVLILSATALTGCTSTKNDSKQKKEFKVAILSMRKLTEPSDLSMLEGVKRLKKELGINPKIIECTEISEYKEQIQAVSEEGYDVVYFIYDNFLSAVEEIAPKYPKTKYIGLWIDLPEKDKLPNLKPLFFKPQEGSFLSGVVAAMMTKTGKVGFIGGGINPGIITFLAGYEAGIKYINTKTELVVSWANTFDDPLKGKELANSLYDRGIDVIFQVANQTGLGVINAAKAQGKYAIGVDVDQSSLAPENVIASCLVDHGYATYNSIKQAYEGKFTNDQVYYGLKEGIDVIAIPAFVPKNVKDKVNEIKQKIIKGEIQIPKTTVSK
ncbi:MAG: BMP family ABC transporter substrate-binding protein [Peptostreptococcaceae bacterium]|nr:BMP family ABC transporter substrate-binding protein [Peptostreptococcaceae bacterium]